jgi:hypothetical protein
VRSSGMILRMWRGRANAKNAGAIFSTSSKRCFPRFTKLKAIAELICCTGPLTAQSNLSLSRSGVHGRRCPVRGPAAGESLRGTRGGSGVTSFEKFVTHFEILHWTEPLSDRLLTVPGRVVYRDFSSSERETTGITVLCEACANLFGAPSLFSGNR